MVRGEGIIVLLQWLWELRGSMQREGQARQGCLKRVCPRALSTDAYKWSQKVGAGRTDRKRPRLQRTQSQQSVHMARVMVQSEGWLSFYNDSGNGSIRCNGRGKPLALRKASGIVRFWKVYAERGVVVLLQWLWNGKVRCNGRSELLPYEK